MGLWARALTPKSGSSLLPSLFSLPLPSLPLALSLSRSLLKDMSPRMHPMNMMLYECSDAEWHWLKIGPNGLTSQRNVCLTVYVGKD